MFTRTSIPVFERFRDLCRASLAHEWQNLPHDDLGLIARNIGAPNWLIFARFAAIWPAHWRAGKIRGPLDNVVISHRKPHSNIRRVRLSVWTLDHTEPERTFALKQAGEPRKFNFCHGSPV